MKHYSLLFFALFSLTASLSACTCGGKGKAPCTPSSCTALAKNCGEVDNGCGQVIHCGYCGGGLLCGQTVPNVCGGEINCSSSTCSLAAAECGAIPDGCGGTLTCGFCTGGQSCLGAGPGNGCGVPPCQPRSCGSAGAQCGALPDGCGGRIDCGDAASCGGGSCGGGGGANLCGPNSCTPLSACPAAACSILSDGCSDTLNCGSCSGGLLCAAGRCVDASDTLGNPCNNDSNCASGRCYKDNTWSQGYCTASCTQDVDCGRSGHCAFNHGQGGLCVQTCTTSCTRSGYLCVDADGDGSRECVPGGTGNGQVGDPCAGLGDCTGGARAICMSASTGASGGYCSVSCGPALPCPGGSHCGFGGAGAACVKDCNANTDCRAGYLCGDWDQDGKTECKPGGGVGDGCTQNADCAGGTCLGAGAAGYSGGYCTASCASDSDCPAGSLCQAGGGQCLKSCGSSFDCRSGGYACVASGTGSACVPYGGGQGGIGSGCNSVADCAGGAGVVCIGGSSGQPGRCAEGCTKASDCGPGSSCVSGSGGAGSCEIGCSSNADCQEGFACTDMGDGPVCLPDNIVGGSGTVGSACSKDQACKGLICIKHKDSGWRDGYCSSPCTTGRPCDAGSHCTVLANQQGASGGLCFSDCSSDADCSRRGFRCWDHDGDGQKECASYASGSGTTGNACVADDDCSGGTLGHCFQPLSFPEGYCTTDCASSSCGNVEHCAEIENDRWCLDAQCCESYVSCDLDRIDSNDYPDCPTGTTCQNVAEAPSQGSLYGYCVQSSATCSAGVACPDGSLCSKDISGVCLLCGSSNRCRDNYDCYDRDATGGRECWPAAKGGGAPGSACAHIRDCNGGVHGSCIAEADDGSWKGGYCLWDCADGTACPSGSSCIDFSYDTPIGVRSFAYCLDLCSSNADCRPSFSCQNPNPAKPAVCFPAPQ